MVANRLDQSTIEQVQILRFQDVPTEEIIRRFPNVSEKLIALYAPSELRGAKRRVAEYIADHPGISYTDIPFREIDTSPHDAAKHIQQLRKANLLTFKTGKMPVLNGHMQAGGTSEKGFFDIRLTSMGERRVEMSRIQTQPTKPKKDTVSQVHGEIAAKTGFIPQEREIRPLPADVLDSGRVLDEPKPLTEFVSDRESVADETAPQFTVVSDEYRESSEPVIPAPVVPKAQEYGLPSQYPVLSSLRKREAKINAANKLLQQATNLLDEAGLTTEALRVLEETSKTTPDFTDAEKELMRMAEDFGV